MSWESFFFRTDGHPLFGCHHAASPEHDRGVGVVLVHSIGQEYVELHRAVRQLAIALADSGFNVLRFDLSSTGDSAGACEDGDAVDWVADVEAALCELSRRAELDTLGLVGVRLGGALAVRAAGARSGGAFLGLWDPVVSGKAFLGELAMQHRAMMQYAHVTEGPVEGRPEHDELLGFVLSNRTRQSIEAVDLASLDVRPARQVLLLQTHPGAPLEDLGAQLRGLGADVAHRQELAPELWEWLEDFGKVRIPQAILQSIVDWLDEVAR